MCLKFRSWNLKIWILIILFRYPCFFFIGEHDSCTVHNNNLYLWLYSVKCDQISYEQIYRIVFWLNILVEHHFISLERQRVPSPNPPTYLIPPHFLPYPLAYLVPVSSLSCPCLVPLLSLSCPCLVFISSLSCPLPVTPPPWNLELDPEALGLVFHSFVCCILATLPPTKPMAILVFFSNTFYKLL